MDLLRAIHSLSTHYKMVIFVCSSNSKQQYRNSLTTYTLSSNWQKWFNVLRIARKCIWKRRRTRKTKHTYTTTIIKSSHSSLIVKIIQSLFSIQLNTKTHTHTLAHEHSNTYTMVPNVKLMHWVPYFICTLNAFIVHLIRPLWKFGFR